jgi:hypothetical protein
MDGPAWADVSDAMKKETSTFVEEKIVNALASLREKLGMYAGSDARDKDLTREAIMDLCDGQWCCR